MGFLRLGCLLGLEDAHGGESGTNNSPIRSDLTKIRILRNWIRVFDIHVDTDNSNPIVFVCGVEYAIGKI